MENNKLVRLEIEPLKALREWGTIAYKSGVMPSNTTIEQCMAVIQTGQELGLQPFQSLRSMAFIKGRLTMEVKLQLALARQQAGVTISEYVLTDKGCKVTLIRGEEKITTEFTEEDAKKANLLEKDNWIHYKKDMMSARAIGRNLKLIAPDVCAGLLSPEEAESLELTEIETKQTTLEEGLKDFTKNLGNGKKEVKTDPTMPNPDIPTEAETIPEKKKGKTTDKPRKTDYISSAMVLILEGNLTTAGLAWEDICQDLDISDLTKLSVDRIVEATNWIKEHTPKTAKKKGEK